VPTVRDEYDAVSHVLTSTYRLEPDQVRQLLRHFFELDAATLCTALDLHITDPDTGRYPPRPADLTRRLVPAPPEPSQIPDRGPTHEVAVPEWVTAATGLRGTVRLSASRCPHCADSGLAWYYHEPSPTGPRKYPRTWEAHEALALSESAFRALRLRAARNAVCNCEAGQRHSTTTPRRYTTLARVRQLTAERRRYEGVAQTHREITSA